MQNNVELTVHVDGTKVITLEMDINDTIAGVKAQIQDKEGMEPNEIQCHSPWRVAFLDESMTLSEAGYEVGKFAPMSVVPAAPGTQQKH